MLQSHFKTAAIAAAVFSTFNVQAADEARTPEVVVTATRTPTRTNELVSDVSVVTRDDIEHSPATNLPDLLATLPGISIVSNGGRGSNTSLFIRGANANHSLVLVDGQRISSATQGTTAFEHIPLEQIDHIEVLRGPASSLYGADAIGGVIQVFTKKGGDGKPVPSFSFGIGSYDTTTGSASYGGKSDDTRFNISAGWESVHGPSSVKNADSTSLFDSFNPDEDDYRNKNASVHVAHSITAGTTIGGDYLEANTKKDFDSANCDIVCTTDFDNRQEQTLRSYSVFADHQLTDMWKSSLRVGRGDDKTKSWSLNPLAGQVNIDHFNTAQTQFNWQNDFTTSIGRFVAAAEWRKEKVDASNGLVVNSRTTKALVAGYQGDFGPHDIQASARVDDIEQIGKANSGSFAYGYRFDNGLSTRASIGRAFHAPTFNDLYWPVDPVNLYEGNPNLKPERGFNREVGLGYDTTNSSTSLTAYYNKVTNLLVYINGAAPTYIGHTENFNEATLRGITFSHLLRIDNWIGRANYDVLSARDDATGRFLPRRAPHSGTIEVRRDFEKFDIGGQVTYTGSRFNDAANTQTMGSYSLLNLDAQYRLTAEWTLQGKISNLFDKDYVLTQSGLNEFGVPGRTLFVNVRYQPK